MRRGTEEAACWISKFSPRGWRDDEASFVESSVLNLEVKGCMSLERCPWGKFVLGSVLQSVASLKKRKQSVTKKHKKCQSLGEWDWFWNKSGLWRDENERRRCIASKKRLNISSADDKKSSFAKLVVIFFAFVFSVRLKTHESKSPPPR